jgi:hypothetical protein
MEPNEKSYADAATVSPVTRRRWFFEAPPETDIVDVKFPGQVAVAICRCGRSWAEGARVGGYLGDACPRCIAGLNQ